MLGEGFARLLHCTCNPRPFVEEVVEVMICLLASPLDLHIHEILGGVDLYAFFAGGNMDRNYPEDFTPI